MSSESDIVRLRPVQESDLEVLQRIDTDPALSEPFEWRGFSNARLRRQQWEADGYLSPDYSLFIVALPDDAVAGIISWRAIPIFGPQGCVELGILMLPDHRGQGLGTAAQRLLADYVFAHTTAHRVEATTDVDNVAEHRALERAGFTREGLLRGRGFGRGEWRDGFMYSRLRHDPAPAR